MSEELIIDDNEVIYNIVCEFCNYLIEHMQDKGISDSQEVVLNKNGLEVKLGFYITLPKDKTVN